MFKRKSRSHSRDKNEDNLGGRSLQSAASDHEDDIQLLSQDVINTEAINTAGNNNNMENNPDENGWGNNGIDHTYDPAFLFTQGHPVGSILLKLTTDLTKLAEQVKLRDMSINVHELCALFQNGTRMERARTNNSILMNNSELEEKILSKELQAHRLESDINCPPYFSPEPVLIDNPHKLNEVSKVFPRAQCFSGIHRDGLMSVSEFLNNLTIAQLQCNISEQEFLAKMLSSSTGLAHDLISMWIQNGCTAEQIYSSLLIHFDKRPSPEEAKTKLYSYRVAKNETLAKAQGNIMLLVGTAAKAVPSGPSRTTYIDIESCQALIRALPEWSKVQVSNLVRQLSAKLGRSLTFNELDQALHALRANIDLDIAQNGVDSNKPINRYPLNKRTAMGRFSSYSMEARENIDSIANKSYPIRKSRTETSFTPRPEYRNKLRHSRAPTSAQNNRVNNNNETHSPRPTHGGGAFNKFNSRPENKNGSNNRGRGFRNPNKGNKNGNANRDKSIEKRCVLCGMSNHKAETCRMMRDDQGNIKAIIPGYGKCTKCPANVQPRLNHPEALCPFRPKGPLFRRNN